MIQLSQRDDTFKAFFDELQQLSELNKRPEFPATTINFSVRVTSIEQAKSIADDICAIHDGKHIVNINFTFDATLYTGRPVHER